MRFLIVILLLPLSGHVIASEDPAETWMSGYLHLQEALATEKEGDKGGAISRLVRALDSYRILARDHGDFEPDRRDERIRLIAEKLESLGADPSMSYLTFPALSETIARSEKNAEPLLFDALASPDSLTAFLRPVIPENWSLRTNAHGTHVIVPLIETDETRRYGALFRRLEIVQGNRVRTIPLVADGGETR